MGGVSCLRAEEKRKVEDANTFSIFKKKTHAFSEAASLMQSHSRVSTVRRDVGETIRRTRTLGADMGTSVCGGLMYQREVHRAALTSH